MALLSLGFGGGVWGDSEVAIAVAGGAGVGGAVSGGFVVAGAGVGGRSIFCKAEFRMISPRKSNDGK